MCTLTMIFVDKSKLDRVPLLLAFDAQTHSHVDELIIKDHISNICVNVLGLLRMVCYPRDVRLLLSVHIATRD
jgi:hypothetical protein